MIMKLGEKIYQLRKEKGLSQEALAEQIGTTRQAVSKWENDQGFPETEKLLQLATIFEVSTDFLLKDEKTIKKSDETGYYVSKEMAKGYIASEKKVSKYMSVGFMFFALAGIPYIMFAQNTTWKYLGMAICIVLGIISCVLGMFAEKEEYKILKQEVLLFDYDVLKQLTNEYKAVKKKYMIITIPCTILCILGLIALALTVRDYVAWSEYHAFIFLAFAIGLLGFIYTVGISDAYELIVKNDQYSRNIFFKFRRMIRNKIDQM